MHVECHKFGQHSVSETEVNGYSWEVSNPVLCRRDVRFESRCREQLSSLSYLCGSSY
jgi:hypothetical protein